MKYKLEVEYGYYDAEDVYYGPIKDTIEVEAEDAPSAEALTWEKVRDKLGNDMITGQKVLVITPEL